MPEIQSDGRPMPTRAPSGRGVGAQPLPTAWLGRNGGTLRCPACDSTWTHVDVVEMFSAGGQQAALYASGEDEKARIDMRVTKTHGTFHGRRHAVELDVNCESCPGVRLRFEQHKGQTLVTVVERGERDDHDED